jgi:hypothetical protein
MDDLRARFATLDAVSVPDVWGDIERRLEVLGSTAPTRQPVAGKPEWRVARADQVATPTNRLPRLRTMALLAAAILAALLIGGAIVVGSGLVRLTSVVPPPDASVNIVPAPARPTIPPTPEATKPAALVPWVRTGSMKVPRDGGLTATLLPDGTVLVAGGYAASGSVDPAPASAELYDPATGQWTLAGSLPSPHRFGHTATLLQDGKVLVAGGYAYLGSGGGPAQQSTSDLYDPATGTWSETSRMRRLGGHTATLLPDGKVLALHDNARGEIYDPTNGSWTKIGEITAGLATVLANGKVLVVATDSTGHPLKTEVYDPSSGAWTPTASPDSRDCVSQAIRLVDGRVLVICDIHRSDATSPAEVYDATLGTWTRTGSPLTVLSGPARVLPDGRVLAADVGAGELYDPVTGTWSTAGLPIYPGRNGGPQEFRMSGGGRWEWYEFDSVTVLRDGRVLMTIGPDAILYDPSVKPR